MSSYEEKIEKGEWPPTNRETAMFVVGALVGGFVVWAIMEAMKKF